MKQMIRKYIAVRNFFFIALAVIAGSANTTAAGGKMVLLCDDRPPFHFVNAEGEMDGHAAKVVRCALEKTGQPYEMKVVPWKRAHEDTKRGKADGFFAASQNPTRDAYAQLSQIIVNLMRPFGNVQSRSERQAG